MKLRESWGSRIGFLMATAGSAIGLGSLWKFPYVTGMNGGGLFVLAYCLFTFIVGLPLFMSEMIIGRASQQSPVLAFTRLTFPQSGWKLVGWSCVFSTLLVLSFYSVVAGWGLNYVCLSLLDFTANRSPKEISDLFDKVYAAGDISLLWTFLFLGWNTLIVYKGVRLGIERWSKILTPALLIVLVILFIFSTTLKGFPKAFSFIFSPSLENMSSAGLLQALGLACFTLSVGMGILITYGSYTSNKDDLPKMAILVALMEIIASLLASLMIFPIIFSFDFTPQEGTGLLFKALPILFTKLPATLLLSTTFFILVVFAALTSAISIMEVLVASASEAFEWSRRKSSIVIGGIGFLLAIPSALAGSDSLFKGWTAIFGNNFFNTVDYFCFTWLLPLNAIFISLFASWILEKKITRENFNLGSRLTSLYQPWFFLTRYVVPIAIVAIMLQESGILKILL